MQRAGAARAQRPSPTERRDPQAHGAESLPLRHPHAHPARGRAPPARGERVRPARGARSHEPRAAFIARRRRARSSASRSCPAPRRRAGRPSCPGSLEQRSRCSTHGSASAPTAASPCSPARPSSARASRPRSSRWRPRSWTSSPARIELVTADTARTPDEGYTAGSQSMQESGTAILHAAAQARAVLAELAAKRLGVPGRAAQRDGAATARRTARSLRRAGRRRRCCTCGRSRSRALRDPAARTVMGKPLPRVDIPAKVTRRRRSTCRTCAFPGCSTRACCGRPATARGCARWTAR